MTIAAIKGRLSVLAGLYSSYYCACGASDAPRDRRGERSAPAKKPLAWQMQAWRLRVEASGIRP